MDMEEASMSDRAFPFLSANQRQSKPRSRGLTEIRGPYYTPMGKRYLQDVLETMGEYVDSLKFAGGSFTLMPRPALVELLNLCHEHNVLVSTGGFLEDVVTQGAEAVDHSVRECREVGVDIIEISCGLISIPSHVSVRLIEKGQKAGLKAKPKVGI